MTTNFAVRFLAFIGLRAPSLEETLGRAETALKLPTAAYVHVTGERRPGWDEMMDPSRVPSVDRKLQAFYTAMRPALLDYPEVLAAIQPDHHYNNEWDRAKAKARFTITAAEAVIGSEFERHFSRFDARTLRHARVMAAMASLHKAILCGGNVARYWDPLKAELRAAA